MMFQAWPTKAKNRIRIITDSRYRSSASGRTSSTASSTSSATRERAMGLLALEQALRPERQHEDQQRERQHALGRRRDQQARDGLGHADQHAASERADHRSQPADDHDDERQQ